MYTSLEAFRAAALRCGPIYYPGETLAPDHIADAYRIYRNAQAGTTSTDLAGEAVPLALTIVGRLALRAEDGAWIPSDERFPSIDAMLQENLGTMGEQSGNRGGVLDAKRWSLLANDAWLLGGLHALTEFHFASPLRWENLWDARAGRMTITAREAIGITHFGYEIRRPHPALEAVAVCTNEQAAAEASLPTYQAAVQAYPDEAALRRFYETRMPVEARG